MKNENFRKILDKKTTQKNLQFSRKPKTWKNLVFFSEIGQKIFYLRDKFDEIIPFLSEFDCVLEMPLADTFNRFGIRFDGILTEEAIENIDNCSKE